MPASPRHPSSPTAMRRGGGGLSPLGSARESEGGSASKNPRRNHASSSTSPPTSSSNPLPALASQSPPALALRTLLGFFLGSLGVLSFLWFSSRATTGEGIPSTLLLARQRAERELARVRVPDGAREGWGDGCSDPSKWILWGRSWADTEGGGPPGGVCKFPQPPTTPPSGNRKAKGAGGGDCASVVGAPKVALMFLTAGTLPHADTWERWLDLAAGLLPTDCVASAACHGRSSASAPPSLASALERACRADRQHLFSLYVHTPKGVDFLEGISPASRFSKALIKNRVATEWGGFTLASATRALLRAALEDPNNQRFALLSESCVPLYSPVVVYAQLIYSEKSRINACADGVKEDWPLDGYRYTWRMKDATNGTLTEETWRKSHQWVGLTRKHATAAARDAVVADAFKKHCTNAPDPDLGGAWRSCFSDEHYFPTLLAIGGWDSETDCEGDMTHTVWCRGWHCVGDAKLHPRTYHSEDFDGFPTSPSEEKEERDEGSDGGEEKEKGKSTSPPATPSTAASFLRSLRKAPPVSIGADPREPCPDDEAAEAAGSLLSPVSALVARARGGKVAVERGRRRRPSGDPAALLGGRCSLFARKFKADVAGRVRGGVVALSVEDYEREQAV